MATKISDLINPTVRDVVPWSEGTDYTTDRIVIVGNSLLKCISTHTSSPSVIADIQSGKWFTISPFSMTKMEREAVTSPINGMQVLETDSIPYVYTYLNGNWMLQNYTASFLRVYNSVKQAPSTSTPIKFNTVDVSLGDSISFNSSTGIFTLQAGGIYEFKGGLGTCYSNNSGGWISSSWQKSTDGTNWTICGNAKMELVSANAWSHVPAMSDAGGYVKADQTLYLRYIPTNITSVSQIGDNSVQAAVGTNQYAWAEIREQSRSSNFKIKLIRDFGTEVQRRDILSPNEGDEFYQTDASSGKYIYNGSRWDKISNLAYLKASNIVSVNPASDTILNFSSGVISNCIKTNMGGGRYELYAGNYILEGVQLLNQNDAGISYQFYNYTTSSYIGEKGNAADVAGSAGTGSPAFAMLECTVDTQIGLRCSNDSATTTAAEGNWLKIQQIS